MPRLRIVVLATLLVLASSSVHAGSVVDRVRAHGVIHCGGKPRPGLVSVGPNGQASGLFLDLCRAIGAGVLGPEGRVEFHAYDSANSYDAVRSGGDEVFFLDASDILGQPGLAEKILPGPPVFYVETAIMVSDTSSAQHVADLAGQPICFSQGSNAHRHLEAWFAAHHLGFTRMGYQEDVELLDTYNAKVCRAFAGEVPTLAQARLDPGINHLNSRILPEPLAVFPILASTATDDPEWSSMVAWAIYSLLRADTPQADWVAGGLASLPIDAPKLGLDKAWQTRVVAAAGPYGEIYRRNLGQASPYRIPRGFNAPWQEGGLFATPYSD